MKAYSPVLLDALSDALRAAYWYKGDLRSFLERAGTPAIFVGSLPWAGTKREIVRECVDRLARRADGLEFLDRVIDALVEQDEDFPHLRRLEDGTRLASDACNALRRLKDMLGKKSVAERAERAREEHRTEALRSAEAVRERRASIKKLNERFVALCGATDAQRRGLDFQELLRDLFNIHDLEPRGSFARPGEQTDGSIRVDSTVLLVEARWTDALTSPGEVREFRTKVHDKLDNTLGLMVSMAGFTNEAQASASAGGRMLVVLMDGQDLAQVLQGLVDLAEMLRRKLRRAAEDGTALHRVS
ncbi:MAG: restriction endonuclease [Deltaproteobacteria bacterium]|nr:restriction endonuclease [Deltaproteobacteria bacterium]